MKYFPKKSVLFINIVFLILARPTLSMTKLLLMSQFKKPYEI
jgi:hypothetical protein